MSKKTKNVSIALEEQDFFRLEQVADELGISNRSVIFRMALKALVKQLRIEEVGKNE